MPRVVQSALYYKACGVFIVPQVAGPPVISPSMTSSTRPVAPVQWYSLLLDKASFVFELPHGVVSGHNFPSATKFVAIFKRFGELPRFKSKCHVERSYGSILLQCTPFLHRKIPTVPCFHLRMSALADNLAPSRAIDLVPVSQPSWPTLGSPASLPAVRPCAFNINLISKLVADYPHFRVSTMALQLLNSTYDTFVGDPAKEVDIPPRHHPDDVTLLIHAAMLKGVAKGFTGPPVSAPPLPGSRTCPVGFKVKDKYDPLCKEIRVTHGFDAGITPLNDLYFLPHFLDYSFNVRHMSELIVEYGVGMRITLRDVPTAFKHLRIAASDRARHTTVTEDPVTRAPLYWPEFSREFGHRVSECGLTAIKAMTLYCIDKLVMSSAARLQIAVYMYVDNVIQPHRPRDCHDRSTMPAEAKFVDECFIKLGIPIHEQESHVYKFYSLGWDWDLDYNHHRFKQVKICPVNKFLYYRSQLDRWARADRLSVRDIREAAGCTQWLSEGFHMGQAYARALIHLRTAADSYLRQCRGSQSSVYIPMTASRHVAAREALRFWASFFTTWDRVCPLVQGFGPNAQAQAWGWIDASTDWGCGGVIFIPHTNAPPTLLGFTHKWSPAERAQAQGPQRESSGVFESLCLLIWLQRFASFCSGLRTNLLTDSMATALAYTKASSSSEAMQSSMRASRLLVAANYMCLRVDWLRGETEPVPAIHANMPANVDAHQRVNTIADLLSPTFGCLLRLVTE